MSVLFFLFSLVELALWLVVITIALIIVLSRPNRRRDTEYFHAKMYAHRGLHDEEVPENSLTAFRLARENGYGVELDVQMTKDKKLVVFHDGSLKRVCGVDGFLRDYTYEELKQFRLNGTDECIPLFSEVLEVLGDTDLICEIKGDNGNKNYELCSRTYDALMEYKGHFCIESFSPYLVAWFKRNHPEIIRGQLSENFMHGKMNKFLAFAMTHLMVNAISRPDFVAYNHKDTGSLGFVICKALYRPFLVAWTAKGQDEQMSAWEVFDSVIFEKNPPKNED